MATRAAGAAVSTKGVNAPPTADDGHLAARDGEAGDARVLAEASGDAAGRGEADGA